MAFNLFKKKKEDKPEGNQRYYDLKVNKIIKETKDAISIEFEKPSDGMSYKPGQFLTLIIPIDGKEVRRSYSLSSSPFVDDNPTVTVKRVEGGLMSNWLPDNLKENDKVRIMEPMGSFTTDYSSGQKRHLVMFAGGSGITPMMSIIKSLLTQESDSIVSLIYANRDIESIIFKEELNKWETDYEGRLHVIHTLDDAPMNWQGHSGLLNKEMLTKIFERIPNWGKENTTYLMCGPEGMMKNVENLLTEEGIAKESIYKESFVAGTIDKELNKKEEADSDDQSHEVTIHYDGEEYKVNVPTGTSILETALEEGIDLPYSCQAGLCTACRCKKISGEMTMDEEEGLSDAEREDGYVLICVGHPKSDDLVLEVG
ncbi:MAG: ferredoxin--NADP reductase [Bacteroidota bacterium]